MRENEDIVLDYLNSLRATFNIGEPLTELSRDAYEDERAEYGVSAVCPVAKALDTPCGIGRAWIARERRPVEFPQFVRDFQIAHDVRIR